jgi:epoxyqueuosine reductase
LSDLPGNRDAAWSFLARAAVEHGLAAIGVAPAGPVDAAVRQELASWLASGRHGSMRYLEKHREQRCDPRHPGIVADADVVVSAALPYASGAVSGGLWDWVAAHARGRDYHSTVRERLTAVARAIEQRYPSCRWRVFADTAPIMERAWAAAAGIGAIGRHGGLIVPGIGARVVLGEIVCADAPKPAKTPSVARFGPCDDCDLCLAACPTGALVGSGAIDARRCLSYQTIEDHAEDPPPDIARLASLVFGCDECTAACPHERATSPSGLEEPARRGPSTMDIAGIVDARPAELGSIISGTCLERTGVAVIQRNARAIAKRKPAIKGAFRGMDGPR